MSELQQEVDKLVKSRQWKAEFQGTAQPIYSYDNDPIHLTDLVKTKLRIRADCKYPLPPNSPDLHRVIEHVMATLKGGMRGYVHSVRGRRPIDEAMGQLRSLFNGLKAKSIADDVAGLHELYKEIIAAKGGWPSGRVR